MADSAAVASVSKVAWSIDGSLSGTASGTGPLVGTPRQKVARYIRFARDNSRFYGVFRREALERSFPLSDFFAADLAVIVGTLLTGDHVEVAEVLMTRNRNDPMSYVSMVDALSDGWWSRRLPLLPFTRYILRELRIPLSPSTVFFLLARNVYDHFRYAALHRSPYGALARFVVSRSDPIRAKAVGDGG